MVRSGQTRRAALLLPGINYDTLRCPACAFLHANMHLTSVDFAVLHEHR